MARGERDRSGPGMGASIEYVMDLPGPQDPLNWRFVQFKVLRELGYPVVIEDVAVTEAREEAREALDDLLPGLRPLYEKQFIDFRDWFRPGVRDPDFKPWLEDWILPDEELLKSKGVTHDDYVDLAWHPGAALPYEVDNGVVRRVREYVLDTQFQHPNMARPGEYRPTFRRSYVSAMQRLMDRAEAAPHYLAMGGGEMEPDRTDIKLYKTFVGNGEEPLIPGQLDVLVEDFYVMLGSIVPEFQSFRQG